uniref:Uncharacterized protein n=1 Tax=Ananas comosus var. bracteatus TaxID=296719 RepID=A0A6V7NF91_ANACO|nr:unnamed protein product [Ananas comosus var. bracteatus]
MPPLHYKYRAPLQTPGIENSELKHPPPRAITNATYDDARELTYIEFPTKWVWHSSDKIWTRRKQGNRTGRIVYIHPNAGELYFLRLLLNKVRGPTNYTEIRTVDSIAYETFRAACYVHVSIQAISAAARKQSTAVDSSQHSNKLSCSQRQTTDSSSRFCSSNSQGVQAAAEEIR